MSLLSHFIRIYMHPHCCKLTLDSFPVSCSIIPGTTIQTCPDLNQKSVPTVKGTTCSPWSQSCCVVQLYPSGCVPSSGVYVYQGCFRIRPWFKARSEAHPFRPTSQRCGVHTVGHRRQVTAVTRLPRWRRRKTRLHVRPLLTML